MTRFMRSARSPLFALMLTTAFALVALQSPGAAADGNETAASPGIAPREMPPGEFTLTGTVVNGETGKPLSGAEVQAWTEPASRDGTPSKDHNVTGGDGAFTLHLNAGHVMLSVNAKGFEPHDVNFELDGNRSWDVKLRPEPPRDGVVTGRVVDADGNPVADARVTLQTRWDERYETMVAEEEAHAVEDDAGCTPDECAEADARATTVRAPEARYEWQETTTDANGAYRFESYAGPRLVTALAEGFAQGEAKVDVTSGENVAPTITLEKVPAADAVLKGRVVDAVTGLPVANAWVNVNNVEWNRWSSAMTGADGTFEVTTLPGYTRIDVHAADGNAYAGDIAVAEGKDDVAVAEGKDDVAVPVDVEGTDAERAREYHPWARTITLESGENAFTAKLAPRPAPTLVVQGYVVDAEKNEAIPDAWVSIRNTDTGEWGHVATDQFGSFKFTVRPGHLMLEAGAAGHFGNVVMLHVDDGDAVTRVDVAVPPGESKWAPCWDACHLDAEPMPAMAAGGGGSGADDGAERAMTEGGDAKSLAGAPEQDSSAFSAPSGNPAYAGSGGGLGPYNAQSTNEAPEGVTPGGAATPPVGLVLALAGVGAAAIALGRSRRS